MKPFFIILLCIASANLLSAKTINKAAKQRQVVARLLQQQGERHSGSRTTVGASDMRVIAQSTRDSMGAIHDSVQLFYAPHMGSTYDYNTMIYPYNYSYSTSPMFNFAGVFTKPQVLFDTCVHWTEDPFTMPSFGLYEATTAGYDGSKNQVTFMDIFMDSVTNTNMSYANTFNADNNINAGYWFRLHSGIADSVFKQFFAYDGSGKLVKDSVYEYHLGAWHLVAKSLYTYDGMDNLTQINYFANDTDTSFTEPIFEKVRYVNTYDASNRLTSVLTKMYTGSALDSYVVDTFAYTGASTFHTSWKEHQYDPINHYWAPMFFMSKVLNGSGLPDTVNIASFDSLMNAWIPQTMEVMHYNTSNYPDTMHEYDYNFTSFPSTPSYNIVYYYETYLNTTATKNMAAEEHPVAVYPNPAMNTITILQPLAISNTTLTYTFINVNGQMVHRENMVAQTETQLSVKDLQPGVYWLVIQDEGGNAVYKQAVVKTPNP